MNPRVEQAKDRAKGFMEGFTPGQRSVVIVAAIGLLMGAFALSRWVSQPNWTVLYGSLSGADASAVTEQLNADGIKYKLTDGGGTILVPQDQVAAERIAISGKGISPSDGEDGWSQRGDAPGNASYYYSATRLATRGTLVLGGRALAVEGQSWLDREWSTSALDEGQTGWDWFALQLDDGRELMLYHLRGRDGRTSPLSSGTLVERDGGARRLELADFELEVLGRWTSPRSGVAYPARWRMRLPTAGLDLELVPAAADAELDLTLCYWEGPAVVLDRARGGAPAGRAYVELVGYDVPAPQESGKPGGH